MTISPVRAQLVIFLSERTNAAFDRYARRIEGDLDLCWQRKRSYLFIRENPVTFAAVQKGEIAVTPMVSEGAVAVPDGLVHDWLGAVFLPGVQLPQVLGFLQNFDIHKRYFSQVVQSKTLSRAGNTIRGFWRLQETQLLTVTYDMEQVAEYTQTDADRWHCLAKATRIAEVEGAGSRHERTYPPGEGHGYLWRFNAYWSLEQTAEGVYAECRTISLSRDVPAAVRWIVRPLIESFPRASMLSTLRGVRQAINKKA